MSIVFAFEAFHNVSLVNRLLKEDEKNKEDEKGKSRRRKKTRKKKKRRDRTMTTLEES